MAATEELRIHLRTVADTTGARQTQQALSGVQRQAAQTGRAIAGASAGAGAGFRQSAGSILQFAGALGIATTASQVFQQTLALVGSSIQAQRDNERIMRATGAAYGAQAQQFERFATALSASTGFASQSILEAAISARTLSTNYGLSIQQTQKLITVSADLARVRGIGVAESFERIQSAIRGEAEASEYLGLTLNDTFLKNNAMNGSLKTTFERMTDAEKAQVRYTELLRQTAPFAGQASASLNTLEGSFGRAEVAANKLLLALGKLAAPGTIAGLRATASAAEGIEKALPRDPGEAAGAAAMVPLLPLAPFTVPVLAKTILDTRARMEARDREASAQASNAAIQDELELQRAILLTNDAIRQRQAQEVPGPSGAFVTQLAAESRGEERRLSGLRERVAAVDQLKAAQAELLNLEQGARQIQQAQAQASIQEAQASMAALGARRGIERELALIDEQQAQRGREVAAFERDALQGARQLALLEREINDVYGERVRLQQESARIGAELASLPAQFGLEDAQERLQRARLVASDRGRSAAERSGARRTIRAEERALPGREIAALDATAALRALDRQQRISGLEGRAAQIPLEERRIDMQDQIRVTQDVVDAIKDQQQQLNLRDDERRNYLQAQLQSSQDVVEALRDQSAQLALVAQVNAGAIESQQDRIGTIITDAIRAGFAQGQAKVDVRVQVATDDRDPAVVFQQLIEANGQAVIPPVVQLSGLRR